MNGKKYDDLGFELTVCQFKTTHERGSSIAGNSTSTTALFSKKFNNLFVKNFPKADFSNEELQVSFCSLSSLQRGSKVDHDVGFRPKISDRLDKKRVLIEILLISR